MESKTELVEQVFADLRSRLPDASTFWLSDRGALADATVAHLKDAPPETVVEFAIAGLRMIRGEYTLMTHVLVQAVGAVLRRKLTFTEDQVVEMLELVAVPRHSFPFRGVLKAAASVPLTPRIAAALRLLRPCITEYLGGSEMRDLHARIDGMLAGPAPQTTLEPEGAWSRIVFEEIAHSEKRLEWERLFAHTAELKSNEASRKWRTAGQALVEPVGRDRFAEAAQRWIALGPSPALAGVQISWGEGDFQRGFLWFLADQPEARLSSRIADFAMACLKKIPMLGAVSQKVGNACVNVLAELPGMDAVSQLSRLARQVRYDTARRLIDEALTRAAVKAGVTRDQLEEMTVPDCGLDAGGRLVEQFDGYTATLSIENTASVNIAWRDADGKTLKTVPAHVKANHADPWKELQRSAKETEKLLMAHRRRIEGLLLTQRPIPVATLRSCYLDHALLSDMSRRLVWQFDDTLGIWHEGRVVDGVGNGIDLDAHGVARLWHPVTSDAQTVLHWRCWLEDRGIRQPFKQAHREIYLITGAERENGTYSNRFAGHVLRQHPFAALCEQRGWKYRLMGQWDSHNTPTLELPALQLRVEYDVDFPTEEDAVSGHQIYLLIRSGAMRFVSDTRVPQPLESIPPAVFSEVMRDLDLFTGVASIGSDPAWGTREDAPFRPYWESFSFGELSEMARARAAVIERMLPRLAIRDRCALDGRFLVVRGQRATYRIHLGSGNVLIEPGSRYLCIVEGAATKASPRNLALPFEEDSRLSLILSKAFLLVEDHKIKDESIRRQLP